MLGMLCRLKALGSYSDSRHSVVVVRAEKREIRDDPGRRERAAERRRMRVTARWKREPRLDRPRGAGACDTHPSGAGRDRGIVLRAR